MATRLPHPHRAPLLLAASLLIVFGGAWFLPRLLGYCWGGGGGVEALVGWLCLLFLAATIAVVLWAASCVRGAGGWGGGRSYLGYAVATDASGLLVLGVGTTSHLLSLADIGRIYLLLIAWLGLCTAVAVALRRERPATAGTGPFSAAATLAAAALCFAAPVTALPLARAAAAAPGGQKWALIVIAHATPMLAVLDAVKPSFRIEWAQLPHMYHLTSFGQDIPLPAPVWWISALAYAILAGLFWAFARPSIVRGK